jgi:O-acetylserine/cysteine efflux transporter
VKRSLTIALIMAVYALCYIGIKIALPHAPPLFFGGIRILVGGVALLVALVVSRSALLPAKGNWGWVIGLALLATFGGTATMFIAAKETSVGLASVLGNLQPILTLALALMFLNEKATGSKLAALILGTIGIILISLPAIASGGFGEAKGSILALTSSLIVAITNVAVKRIAGEELLRIVTWQLLIGSIPLFVASLATESWQAVHFNGPFVLTALVLGMLGTAFVNYAWYRVIQREDVSRVGMFFFLVPVIGLLSGVLLFGEKITAVQAAGIVVTVVALAFLRTKTPKEVRS